MASKILGEVLDSWIRACVRFVGLGSFLFPVVFGSAGLFGASQGDDGVGAANGPVHAGVLEALSDDGATAGFDNAGADEESTGSKVGVPHARGIDLEVANLFAKLFGSERIGGVNAVEGSNKILDESLVELLDT